MISFFEDINLFLPLIFTLIFVSAVVYSTYWVLLKRKPEIGNEKKLPRQLILLTLTLFGALSIILSLPVSESTRNQLIGLTGVLLSAVIAFSSSTVISNFMSGIMLRINKPFRTGDFIRVGEYFGRVAERGLFDTEIQTENRELVSLPNTHLITTPITVVRSSGTIISAELSLGYDIHNNKIQSLLVEAAQKTGLEDPFVQIIELGNFSVTYRVSGLLTEIKSMLTTRSNLFRNILDTIHEEDIEILSPSFMNQRPLENKVKVIPQREKKSVSLETPDVEQIVFDKAEQAELIENSKHKIIENINELENQLKQAADKNKHKIEDQLATKRKILDQLENPEKE